MVGARFLICLLFKVDTNKYLLEISFDETETESESFLLMSFENEEDNYGLGLNRAS